MFIYIYVKEEWKKISSSWKTVRSKVSSSEFYDPLPYPQPSMGSAWSEQDYITMWPTFRCRSMCNVNVHQYARLFSMTSFSLVNTREQIDLEQCLSSNFLTTVTGLYKGVKVYLMNNFWENQKNTEQMYIVKWVCCFSASVSLITAEEVGLYLPLVLCVGTVLSVGFGPPVEANSVLLVSNECIIYSLPINLNYVNMLKNILI